jgi:hypothetical protein
MMAGVAVKQMRPGVGHAGAEGEGGDLVMGLSYHFRDPGLVEKSERETTISNWES